MSGFDGFIGNERLIQRLKHDIETGSLSHAYIIEGTEGCGKRTLAGLICRTIACESPDSPCMECISCDKITRSQAPDVITVVPESDRIYLGVDVIRRLIEEAYFAPVELPKKIYIIPNAELMNIQAQNALLKILEEPPPHIMFLLLTENADSLLPTIRSRAPTLRLEPLPDKLVESHLNSARIAPTDEETFKAVLKLAHGSIGKAVSLLSGGNSAKTLELYKKAKKYMELLSKKKSAAEELAFYEYASKLVSQKNREDAEAVYSLLSDAVRDTIAVKLTSSPELVFYTSVKDAEDIANEFSIGSLMNLANIFADTAAAVSGNVNLNLALIKAASDAAKRSR